jgi:hypothetical protein
VLEVVSDGAATEPRPSCCGEKLDALAGAQDRSAEYDVVDVVQPTRGGRTLIVRLPYRCGLRMSHGVAGH